MAEPLREVKPGDPITAAWANSLVKFIKQSLKISVASPLQLSQGPHGVHIHMARPQEDKLIELTEDLSSGGSATADRLLWNGTDWTSTGAEEITVYDSIGGSRDGASGDRGWAFFSRESGRWELKALGC